MRALQRIGETPDNIDEFVEEIAPGMGEIYGAAAERDYLNAAGHRFALTVGHPQVDTLAWFDGTRAAGLLWHMTRQSVGYIGLVHVLRPFVGRGIEKQLVRQAVADLRAKNVRAIVFEGLGFSAASLDEAFADAGFEKAERLLMSASLSTPELAHEGPPLSEPCARRDWRRAAAVIVDTYRDHPDRRIHPDVHCVDDCEQFVSNAACGTFGTTQDRYHRILSRGGKAAGIVLGCEVAPENGFVLQVAVRPEFQGQGLGTRLLQELAHEFRVSSLPRIALGVTASNPARRLYERLGFEPRRAVDSYVWWRT
jgi:ribosomal protein S18 acetylase RimI-like enzyme